VEEAARGAAVTLRYEAERHLYFVDDELVPNVTRIISGLNLQETRWFTDEAAERGRHVHECVHLLMLGTLDPASIFPAYRGYVESAARLLEDAGVDCSKVRTEVRVYNAALGYCGTADYLGPFAGAEACLDWKSGALGAPVGIQTALYDLADPLPGGERRRRYGAQLKANGKFPNVVALDRKPYDVQGYDYARARAAVDLYRTFVFERERRELYVA
jgi:hypothetical protein